VKLARKIGGNPALAQFELEIMPGAAVEGKHSPLSPGSLIVDAASDVGQGRVFTLSRQ